MMKKKIVKKEVKLNAHCPFCINRTDPNYLEVDELKKLVSDRGRILSRGRSGLCSKHQKKLAIAVKRARHLGLLPFKGGF